MKVRPKTESSRRLFALVCMHGGCSRSWVVGGGW